MKKGDVVQCDMRGWTFLAYVEDVIKKRGEQTMLMITPDKPNCSHRHCFASDVKKHYKRMQRPRSRKIENAKTVQDMQ